MGSRLWLVGVAFAVAAGAMARVACLGAEFWLDEIWSLELARAAGSPSAVLFDTKHDNNHHLNTLFLYFAPEGVWWGWYRLPSLLAGTASIAMAAKVARRWGRTEAVVAAWLLAGCSWLVLASAEARGYALCVLFALIAFDALWGYVDTRSRTSLVVYWVATGLGFMSHLTFIYATMGFVVWSLRRFARERSTPGGELSQLALTHGPPGLLVVAFYFLAVRGMEKGGGPPASTFEVLARLIGQGLGGLAGWWSLPWLLAAAGLFAFGVWRLRREGSDLWVFFLVSCVLAPGLYLLFRPPYLFERYFFVSFTFFLVLAAKAIGGGRREANEAGPPRPEGRGYTPTKPGEPGSPEAITPRGAIASTQPGSPGFGEGVAPPFQGGAARLVAPLVLLAFLIGNGLTVWRFVEAGRGDFHEALAWVLEEDESETVLVTREPSEPGKGHDFRVRKYVWFYSRRFPERNVRLLDAEADWLLVYRLDDSLPDDREPDGEGRNYQLVKSFPSRGPGAWGWFVYRKIE